MSTSSPTLVTSRDTGDDDSSTPQRLPVYGVKRALPDSGGSESDDEVKRLRDKNRTNSKRFRDRKKSYMDGLFEEKYRLGKANNDLRDDNEKLRRLLEEAILENQTHKRNAGLGLYNVQSSRIPPPPANTQSLLGLPHSNMVSRARHLNPLVDIDRLHQSARLEKELIGLRHGQFGSTPSVWHGMSPAVLDLLEARKREQMLHELALRDMGASVASNVLTNQPTDLGVASSLYERQLRFL